MFAYTNMVVDPSEFHTTSPVKKWIDTSIMIPLSGKTHHIQTISITPVIFSKEEEII